MDQFVDSQIGLGLNNYSSLVPNVGLGSVGRSGFPYEIHCRAQPSFNLSQCLSKGPFVDCCQKPENQGLVVTTTPPPSFYYTGLTRGKK